MVLLKYDIQSLPYLWKTFPWITSELVCLKKQEITYYSGIISTPPSRHSLAVVSLRYEKDKRLREDIDNSPPPLSSKFFHLTSVAMGLVAEVAALDASVTSVNISTTMNMRLVGPWGYLISIMWDCGGYDKKVQMRQEGILTSCNQGCTPHPCKPTPRQRIVAGGWKYIICRSNCEMQFPYRIEGMKKTNTLGIV